MSASLTVSSQDKIFAALRASNPFERPPVVKEQNIWEESFPDVLSINAQASDRVFDELKKLRSADSDIHKVTSLILTAEKGMGKSHIIRRIRRRLQATGEGVFVYASADKYGDLSFINMLFRRSLAESLEQTGSEGVTQWQEIATLIVVAAIRANDPTAAIPAAANIVSKFDKALQAKRKQGRDLVTELVKAIRKQHPKTDPYIIRAMVWTLSEEWSPIVVKWLAGEPIDSQDAIELRLPLNNTSDEEANALALSTSAQLISFLGEYKSVVVCLDELDTIASDENGFTTEIVLLDLVKRLFGAVSQTKSGKGVVFLSALITNRWSLVTQTNQFSPEKISSYGKPSELQYLNSETAKDLAAAILKTFYSKKGLVPPTPIYQQFQIPT